MLNFRALIFLFNLFLQFSLSANAQTPKIFPVREAYYAALASDNIQVIQEQLDNIAHEKSAGIAAFEGALKMKKAAFLKSASQKLKEFNAGRKKLEDMIAKNRDNAEFRFLRLMIQERAPKMLKYDKQVEEDRQFIILHFKTTSKPVQQAILNYSKSSTLLSPNDF